MAKKSPLPFLKVGTEWIELEIISDADVILTTFGYTPFLQVQEIRTGTEYQLYISAKSLAEPLEKLRKDNSNTFEGIQLRIRKENADRKARYEVDTDVDSQKRLKLSIDASDDTQERPQPSEDMKKKLENVLLN